VNAKQHSTATLLASAAIAFSAGLYWDQWRPMPSNSDQSLMPQVNSTSKRSLEQKTSSLAPLPKKSNHLGNSALGVIGMASDNQRVSFKKQLTAHNYVAAIDIYQLSLDANDTGDLGLKPLLMEHIEMLISSSSQSQFTELTELYLSVFYDDIDVLLSLAKFNRSTGFLAEAAAILHLVKSYAYTNRDKITVEATIDDFISQVHTDLVSADDLFGLANIYQQMHRLNLLTPMHRLRQAQLSIQTGSMASAREILADLIQEPSVSAEAEQIMLNHQQELSLGKGNKMAMKNGYSDQIVLARRGNQYLADLEIQDTKVALLIDTGASMTTLSQQAFQTLSNNHTFNLLGQRIFNTANGIAKGNIYQVDSLTLGRFTLAGIQIAVLDFSMPDGVDGLLGMNILANFRFHIDQKAQMLYLADR
jgi:clan AA aspartic protease (TIGR02281 family)|tara:strand:- start:608 stop:1864 length:1257 start_codon:yes stop_codon:yes gene_type:complete